MTIPSPLRSVFPAILLAGISATAAATETEWPQFRGPTGEGISCAKDVPIEWTDTKNVAWKQEIPGKGWSSPVLSKGRLYLTSAVTAPENSEVTLHVLCMEASTGALVWDKEVIHPDPASVAAIHSKNSPASPTPIIDGDRLYVHFGHMGTAELSLDGAILWTQKDIKYPPVHGNGGSPVLFDHHLLIFGCDGAKDPALIALDAATGQVSWKTPRNTGAKKTFSFCTPLIIDADGKKELISPFSGFVGGYDPRDGHELWRVAYGEGYSVVPRPVFAQGLLFLSSGFDQPVLYAIDPKGANGDVTATNIAWTQRKGAPCTPSTLVLDDALYYVSDGGIATCADPKTGKAYWSERLGGSFSSSPIAAEGRIYFQNESGVGYVIQAGKTYQLLSKNDLGERSLASYAVTDGALFIRTESHLWKIAK